MSYSRSIVDDLEWNQDSGQYEPAEYVLTVNPTPADATVNFDTGTVSGNTCSVLYNTTVHYTISKTGYITSETYTKTVIQDETINAPALTIETHTLTIDPTPADATVILSASGYTQVGNSITVDENTSVVIAINKTGYVPYLDTTTVTQDETLTIELEEGYVVKSIQNTTFQNKPNLISVNLNDIRWKNNSMYQAFVSCTNLTTVTNIHNQVTNMAETFKNCIALTGDIIIPSSQITNVLDIFANTTAIKNVYIPFNSTTHTTFTSAGYDEYGTKEGVYLKNINQ